MDIPDFSAATSIHLGWEMLVDGVLAVQHHNELLDHFLQQIEPLGILPDSREKIRAAVLGSLPDAETSEHNLVTLRIYRSNRSESLNKEHSSEKQGDKGWGFFIVTAMDKSTQPAASPFPVKTIEIYLYPEGS